MRKFWRKLCLSKHSVKEKENNMSVQINVTPRDKSLEKKKTPEFAFIVIFR